jgi:hypothetical protein
MDRRLFLLAAMALGGCATLRVPSASPAALGELEPLFAVVAGPDGVTVSLASHGCTAKADIAVYVERRGRAAALAFGRKRVDVCRAGEGPTEIVFSWAELGLDPKTPIFPLNPIGAPA